MGFSLQHITLSVGFTKQKIESSVVRQNTKQHVINNFLYNLSQNIKMDDCWTNLVEWIRTKIKVIVIVSTILFCFVSFTNSGCEHLQVKLANFLEGNLSGYTLRWLTFLAILFIVVGGIMLTISSMSSIGARSDVPCLLKTFVCLIGIIVLLYLLCILFMSIIFLPMLFDSL